jgi:hypothetical protein
MVVGTAKRGVQVEVGATERVLARTRYGAAAGRIDSMGYGDALTLEVVADPDQPGGVALSRVGIERSIRQAREIDGVLARSGTGFELRPADGSAAFAVVVLDVLDPGSLLGGEQRWSVGAPYRGLRLIEPSDAFFA